MCVSKLRVRIVQTIELRSEREQVIVIEENVGGGGGGWGWGGVRGTKETHD